MTDRGRAQRLLSAFDMAMQTTFAHAIVYGCWPEGYRPCTAYSLLAAPMLRIGLDDPDVRVTIGTYQDKNHCWTETGDRWILDPTHGQFDSLGLRWRVFDPFDEKRRKGFNPEYVLDIEEEDIYRFTITHEGNTKIKTDFWNRPIDTVRSLEA